MSKQTCCESVYKGNFIREQCGKPAIVERHACWYCAEHDPTVPENLALREELERTKAMLGKEQECSKLRYAENKKLREHIEALEKMAARVTKVRDQAIDKLNKIVKGQADD